VIERVCRAENDKRHRRDWPKMSAIHTIYSFVAYRSGKAALFRGAKGESPAVIDISVLRSF
jgi:hypothetical protein